MIGVTIDGRTIAVEEGTTLLDAARSIGIKIPTLCHHDGLPPDGNCRLCAVEVDERGRKKLVSSCMYPIKSEISADTKNERVIAARRFVVQLLINRNPKAIAIGELAKEYGVVREERFALEADLCVRCGRCVRACESNGTDAIGMARAGFERYVAAPYDEAPESCVGCASCAEVCPTGKITYKDDGLIRKIWNRTFDLAVCRRCGSRYATKEQLAHIGRLGAANIAVEDIDEPRLCDKCRKAIYTAKFKTGS
ncbi:MAG: (2Fe-2S)-binding protein [Synergistaceae bacterium]|jgi:NADH dehydrogenase/NADH:ubiquinone oxidoreductase subunit G|nr:(2Fe-2S)-binding protein [Synergistaceae bacterium]